MRNNKFIDFITADKTEKEYEVMLPESKLDTYMSADKELKNLRYTTLFHKHFFENIDSEFPYPLLTLEEIGIPLWDVIQVSTDKGLFYVELAADKHLFQ